MKNSLNYYYDIFVENLIKSDNDYYFYLKNEEYHLIKFDRPVEDIKPIYELNVEMLKRKILVHKIILNRKNEIITLINDIPFILLKKSGYNNDKTFLNDIGYIQNYTLKIEYKNELLRTDWVKMWSDKIDYYEYQISQFGKKYLILCDSLSYYIGLGENAISYLINNMEKYQKNDEKIVVSHKRVDVHDGSFQFYNPINLIMDSRVRDVGEYIKNCFFYDTLNIYELKSFLDNSKFEPFEYVLLFSRLLFPTYYFDMYDEIINNNLNENKIIDILEKNEMYEKLLIEMYNYIVYEREIFIEPIEWLIRKN